MSKEEFGLRELGQIAFPVSDLKRSVAFYRDQLGLPFLFSAPPALAFFDCSGIRLMLSEPEESEFKPSQAVLYYSVQDLAAAYAALRQRGVTFESEPHVVHRDERVELSMAFFRDPDGNLLAVMSEMNRAT